MRQGLQFLVLLMLARQLQPADFGVVALLALFVAVAVVVADLGLTTAILRTRQLSPADLSTAFWLTLVAGAGLTVLAGCLAQPVATALDVPGYGPLGAVMALSIVLTAAGAVPSALLVKRLEFGRLLIVGTVGAVLSGGVALSLAVAGAGPWALAAQAVVMAAATAVGAWVSAPVAVERRWDEQAARRLLGTGRFVLAANVCDVVATRTQSLVIGSVFGPASLGLYMRADSTQQMPADAAGSVLSRVALPVFAESADQPGALRAGLRTSLRSAMAVNAPAMAMLGGLAEPVVRTLYGSQWEASAQLLSVLCLAGILWPMHIMNINLLYAFDRARQVLVIDIVKKSLGLVLIGVGAAFGLYGVAWAQVGLGLLAVVVNGRATFNAVQFGPAEQVRCVAPVVALALAVGGGAHVAADLWAAPAPLELVVLGAAGALTYLALAHLLGVRAILETLDMMRLKVRQP